MFLKKSKNSKTGRTQLSIVHGYWDAKLKKKREKVILKCGYLDSLEKEFDDPIEHFKNLAKEMNSEYLENKAIMLEINANETLDMDTHPFNLGYIPFLKKYHELEIDAFFKKYQRTKKLKFDLSKIMQLLVYSRILFPSSKKKTFENKGIFFEKFDFSLDDVYRALSSFNDCKEALQKFIHEKMCVKFNRDTSLVYYDVTNYYFELDYQDELKRKGVSKEHRPEPIVQMGLLMDSNSIPISYKLFPGNTNDCETLIPVLSEIKKEFKTDKMIVVADKGLNTHKNIVTNILRGNGYVFSQSVRKAHKELKDFVLEDSGYTTTDNGFKIKSRVYPKEVTITDIHKKQKKIRIDEKQVIFYSPEYDYRAKKERESTIKKAYDLVNNPSKHNKTTSYGACKYVNNISFDKDTGEIVDGKALSFNLEKLIEDEKFDGYYAIVTSELDKSDSEIIEIYRGLWRIEETFKITKSNLSTRPVYVSLEEHIQGHFLTCFISLVLIRLLERDLNYKYSAGRLIDSLKKYDVTNLNSNFYTGTYYDEIINDINLNANLNFEKKYYQLKNIKKIIADAKKTP